ncbi:conserved hypothetical protein [Acidovorax delafieldii 2AN]|uniref:Uncharacterized protein n=1 Tax=Acidovorax delafieldii 2AN TaxID=573060 RepID=C5T476_ACIDE|nr:hypothetical protein [Acidovorax delafieldii]EER60728.1 conserved hypothetical protein [Acidovorax delafieldii 2AN]
MAIPYTFVSLLDVLGYKNKINDDRHNGKEDFKQKLESALSVLNGINETEISYQAISDTIIVSTHPSTPFPDFLRTLVRVHRSFLKNGLFIRGGISFAPHFKSGSLTYSHALPIAYEIEQKQAIYPRIVIDKNIIEMMKLGEKLEAAIIEINDEKLICKENGIYFLNIVGESSAECYYLAKSIYNSEKSFLEGNEHELAKHRWLQNLIVALSGATLTPYMDGVEIFYPSVLA